MRTHTVAEFVTGLRAASLKEALAARGIAADTVQPKWTNKRLPPPRIAVRVAETDADAARIVLADFLKKS